MRKFIVGALGTLAVSLSSQYAAAGWGIHWGGYGYRVYSRPYITVYAPSSAVYASPSREYFAFTIGLPEGESQFAPIVTPTSTPPAVTPAVVTPAVAPTVAPTVAPAAEPKTTPPVAPAPAPAPQIAPVKPVEPQPAAPAPAPQVAPATAPATMTAGYYTLNELGIVYLQPSSEKNAMLLTQLSPTSKGEVYSEGYYNVSGVGLVYIQPSAQALAQKSALANRTTPTPAPGPSPSRFSPRSFTPPQTQFVRNDRRLPFNGGNQQVLNGNQQSADSAPLNAGSQQTVGNAFRSEPVRNGNQQFPGSVLPGAPADGGNQRTLGGARSR